MCYEGMGSTSTCDYVYDYIMAYRKAEAVPSGVTPLVSTFCDVLGSGCQEYEWY